MPIFVFSIISRFIFRTKRFCLDVVSAVRTRSVAEKKDRCSVGTTVFFFCMPFAYVCGAHKIAFFAHRCCGQFSIKQKSAQPKLRTKNA